MRFCLLAITVFFLNYSSVQADIIVDVQDATLNENNTGFVDVYISSNNNAQIGRFGYKFKITGPDPLTNGFVDFRDPQLLTEQAIGGIGITAPYVFYQNTDLDALTSIRTANDTIVGSDTVGAAGDPNPPDFVTLTTGTTYLLARLEIEHLGTFSAPAQFTVDFVQDSFTFIDPDFDAVNNNNLTGVTFQSGIVSTITAVPEPSSMALLCLGAAGVFARRSRRWIRAMQSL